MAMMPGTMCDCCRPSPGGLFAGIGRLDRGGGGGGLAKAGPSSPSRPVARPAPDRSTDGAPPRSPPKLLPPRPRPPPRVPVAGLPVAPPPAPPSDRPPKASENPPPPMPGRDCGGAADDCGGRCSGRAGTGIGWGRAGGGRTGAAAAAAARGAGADPPAKFAAAPPPSPAVVSSAAKARNSLALVRNWRWSPCPNSAWRATAPGSPERRWGRKAIMTSSSDGRDPPPALPLPPPFPLGLPPP